MKLDFPKFNGSEDPTRWICRADQFFEFHQTPEDDRTPLASFNLEGNAQGMVLLNSKNFFGDLTKLEQTGSMRDYQTQFERLLICARKLSQEQQVDCFTSGLVIGLQVEVKATKPTSHWISWTVRGSPSTYREDIWH